MRRTRATTITTNTGNRVSVREFMSALHETIVAQVQERERLKAGKEYGRADTVRDVLLSVRVGMYRIRLEDKPDGRTEWQWTARPS
jgi:cysteinyl-tRNA synthetase